jgi:hypothetical protein
MICEKVLERVDWTEFTGSNCISMLIEYQKINLAEEKAKAEPPSDAETLQPDTTQQLDANAEKAVDAAQSADPKPSAQETTAKERDNGAHVGPLTKLLDEMVGAEPGKSQDGNVQAQSPQTPTVQ